MNSKPFRWRYSGVAFRYSLALFLMSLTSTLWLVYITRQGTDFASGLISGLIQWPLLYIYISVGVRYARKLELPGALFWKRLSFYPFSIDEDDDRMNKVHGLNTTTGLMLYRSTMVPEYLEIQSMHSELTDRLNRKWWMKFDLIVVLGVLIATVYTVILFNITQPEASSMIRLIQQSNPNGLTKDMSLVLLILIFARLAAAEEIFFRLSVQTLVEWGLRKNRYAASIAVVFSSVFWTLGHVGVLVPEWVKMAQIFPFGIALGLIYRRYGIEAAILIHVVFNVAMIFLAPGFVSL
ncbi:lysostaphin resistance A-like protein [Fusibacter sp. JL216-2]|uniref:CPBP family intramembrane glutamic endopeptidase n=1 Tax=Fusibacter sp. JL216-2 TaxID=3071453 RepID=UPI003D3459A7